MAANMWKIGQTYDLTFISAVSLIKEIGDVLSLKTQEKILEKRRIKKHR